uniref:Secreted protein n=1 Tax=Anguilla anguilla TaxID=7936 RepID=A0A0E9X082_ANGAN
MAHAVTGCVSMKIALRCIKLHLLCLLLHRSLAQCGCILISQQNFLPTLRSSFLRVWCFPKQRIQGFFQTCWWFKVAPAIAGCMKDGENLAHYTEGNV